MANINNDKYKNISKKELFDKLHKLDNADFKRLNITKDEIEYIKNKILNDKLGLVLNFEEKDEDLENNYFGLEEVPELGVNIPPPMLVPKIIVLRNIIF